MNKIQLTILIICVFIAFFFLNPPVDFPKGFIFSIEEGSSLRQVSLDLKNENIIRSRTLFETFVILYGGEKHIIYADYLFESPVSVFEVARRFSKGERHLAPVKITIPEGFNIYDIAYVASLNLLSFNKDKFLLYAKEKEGSLFPDTYFFFTNATEEDVIKSLNDNFEKKISTLEKDIIQSGKTEVDIIKMASIIEKESKGSVDRDVISGILWRRISIGIPLQVDADPATYQNKGLPKRPICNPGLLSIKAAIYPRNSPYLYYLHDKMGSIHYAKSFAEHRQNIDKYLK